MEQTRKSAAASWAYSCLQHPSYKAHAHAVLPHYFKYLTLTFDLDLPSFKSVISIVVARFIRFCRSICCLNLNISNHFIILSVPLSLFAQNLECLCVFKLTKKAFSNLKFIFLVKKLIKLKNRKKSFSASYCTNGNHKTYYS